jgi:RNA polymerase sigma factor for flagellar operon FliA
MSRSANRSTSPEQERQRLWQAYAKRPTVANRNALVRENLRLIDAVAKELSQRLPREVDFNDLRSWGVFGLLDAIRSFEPERGLKFSTFASQRIRGAILDEIRKFDEVPRLIRGRTKLIENARQKFYGEHGRQPSHDE